MANFEPAFSKEMADQIVLDIYEYIKAGEVSKKKVIGVSREMIAKRDDEGNLVYYDIRADGKEKPIVLDTMIGRIRIIVKDWKKYLAPLMEPLLLEAAYQHAVKSKDSTASFKTAAEMIMPKERADDGIKPVLSPSAESILRKGAVGTRITIGQAGSPKRAGENGHECPDTVHPLADGQRQDITVEVVSLGHDKSVYGVHEGGDTTQRHIVPDTEMAPEDTVDDDSGVDLDTPE